MIIAVFVLTVSEAVEGVVTVAFRNVVEVPHEAELTVPVTT